MRISDWSSDVCSSDLVRSTARSVSKTSGPPSASTRTTSTAAGRSVATLGAGAAGDVDVDPNAGSHTGYGPAVDAGDSDGGRVVAPTDTASHDTWPRPTWRTARPSSPSSVCPRRVKRAHPGRPDSTPGG